MDVHEPTNERAGVLRERERRARRRRMVRLETMRATVEALERALPVVLTLDGSPVDQEVRWDGFLDDRALRVRTVMRQSLELAHEARRLRAVQGQLERALREHRFAARKIGHLLAADQGDEWDAHVDRWCQLTRRHFRPWTRAACEAEARRGLEEMEALLGSSDTHTTGLCFLGWRDRRRIDATSRSLQWVFDKEFPNCDMVEFVDKVWMAYTNADVYQRVVMGKSTRSSVDIVQEISPTMCIVRYDEQYPTLSKTVHMMYLVVRVRTANGFAHCMRSIDAREVQHAVCGSGDLWATNFVWLKWEAIAEHDHAQGYRLFAGGAIAGNDMEYATWWLIETLATLTRGESWVTRRALLRSS